MDNTAISRATLAPYLSALNIEQREAVETTEGPVLVLAGAGTGKTRVLTSRIAHLLYIRKALPGQILAVTFTNKAAREMSQRVQKLLSGGESMPSIALHWMGTFHSIGARILRRHAEKVGLASTFTILDEDDQIRIIKALLKQQNIDEKQLAAKSVLATIQQWKDQGLTPEKVTAHSEHAHRILPLYTLYQERLKNLNATDFGDLLLFNLIIFQQYPEVLAEYAQRFRYILVDEYQDTNVAQYLWLRLLAIGHKNICCVGDDDQSIYSWRGAEVGNILRFEKDFPEARIIRLERNYRSTSHILGAASGLISNNKERLGKTLWTEDNEGTRIRLKPVWDEQEEARFVTEETEHYRRQSLPYSDVAILVRAGFQTRAFEERFLTEGIPYRVVGGLRFYERQEIRDVVAYLRLIYQPNDDLAFERIINLPKRGVGKATLEQLHTTARKMQLSLFSAAQKLIQSGNIKGKLGAAISAFLNCMHLWQDNAKELPLPELCEKVLDESGYRAMWQQDRSPEAPGRLENLKELVRAMGEFETLELFLEHVGLVMDMENRENGDMVNIMTLHAAKGLEFSAVFLPGWEEGLFPHPRALEESGTRGLEEERRLAYVGITRARKHLTIIHAANRRIYNQWQASLPSRFLDELPQEHVEHAEGGPMRYGNGNRNWKLEAEAILVAHAGKGLEQKQHTTFNAPPSQSAYAAGQRIFHVKFGYGTIQTAHGNHLDIAFEKAGHKKVMADYVTPAEKV